MNITSRLEHLFPFLDVRPQDGKISAEELSHWQTAQERKTSLHRTMREVEVMDRNHDGHVSIKEYLNDESPGDTCEDTPRVNSPAPGRNLKIEDCGLHFGWCSGEGAHRAGQQHHRAVAAS